MALRILKRDTDVLLIPAAIMFLLQLIQAIGVPLNRSLGIIPRDFAHLPGIACAPFLHGSWDHYKGNMSGWYVIGTQVLMDGWYSFTVTFVVVALCGGTLQWIIGDGG